ncbi:MAG TPA: AMP-binding protein [Acidimicrobiia bacterium]|nr:AMP-binding protein [Acidimicrobiia bacterium]
MEDGLTLGRAITVLAEEAPDRPAVTGWEPDGSVRSVTRAELDLRTNRIAREWADLGVGEGDFVTIALPNSVAFLESAIAAWKLGAVPQPLSARLPDRERQAIVELADSKLVVGADPGAHPGRRVLPVGWDADPSTSDAALPDRVSPSHRAMASGGSTGRPKLIVNGSPGVVSIGLAAACRIEPDGCHIVPGPLFHNGPFGLSSFGLTLGNHVVVFPRFDAEATLRAIDEHHGTFMFVVPTMMLRIWRLGEAVRERYDMTSLQTVWHFAAPCPDWLKADWIDWLGGERIWELYGGTELQAMTIIRGDEWLEHRGSVGRCAIGEMKVADPDTGVDLAPGEIGEIYMRRDGDGTPAYRYLGSEARTLPGHWESLGDMGSMDADGYVYLSDRRADMILVGGENVYPAEVESALMEHPRVLSAAVIGLPDDDLGNRIHAIVQVTERLTDDELTTFLAERIARNKTPRTFEYTDEPVRDDAGKVRRSALRTDRL